MKGYVLDTNVFNMVLDGRAELPALGPGLSYFASYVQRDELTATRDEPRRLRLLRQFAEIDPSALPTESFVIGVARMGMAKLSDGVLFNGIRDELHRRNRRKPSNTQDALIAEIAIRTGLTLVTEDRDLAQVTTQYGGSAIGVALIDPDDPPAPSAPPAPGA